MNYAFEKLDQLREKVTKTPGSCVCSGMNYVLDKLDQSRIRNDVDSLHPM